MKRKNIMLLVFFLTLFVFQQAQAGGTMPSVANPSINLAPANSYLDYVWLYILKLNPDGSILKPDTKCIVGSIGDGCAEAGYAFPVMNNPIYIDVESDYLRNVLPRELDVQSNDPTPSALQAQAIAARTYATWTATKKKYGEYEVIPFDEHYNNQINNSTDYQVYYPDSYDHFLNPNDPDGVKQMISTAISSTFGIHLTPAGDIHVIDAEFGSDVGGHTETEGTKEYLVRIEDPISTICGAVTDYSNYSGWGMSQKGALRWSKGNQCATGGDINTAWPVTWTDYRQILVHYYTGIDILGPNGKVAPNDRWNLLKHNNFGSPIGVTPVLNGGQSASIELNLQNTSTSNWNANDIELGYQWTPPDDAEGNPYPTNPQAWQVLTDVDFPGILAGKEYPEIAAGPLTVTNIVAPFYEGNYILHLDLRHTTTGTGGWFSEQSPAWPDVKIPVHVNGCPAEWNLATDFIVSSQTNPIPPNPNPDSCGNPVWGFEGSTTRPVNTNPLNLSTNSSSGWTDWIGTEADPYPLESNAHYPVISGNGASIGMHPGNTTMAVVAWYSPLTGYVYIKGNVKDNNPYTAGTCNEHGIPQDGIKWYIDKNSIELASGSIKNASDHTGSQIFADGNGGVWLNKVPVDDDDVIYLAIHPDNNLYCDSTGVNLSIKVTDAPLIFPPSYSNLVDPEFTDADSVSFTVTFDEPVTGVDDTDFHLTTTGSISGASIGTVNCSGDTNTTCTVQVNTGTGDGTIRLDAISADGILTSDAYTIDKTPLTVESIVRADANPTNADSVSFIVTFSEDVTGVDVNDFSLATTGSISGASVSSVEGLGDTYTVTVNTGSGDGTIRLDVADNDSIIGTDSSPLGGVGIGNGDFTAGEVYDIDKTAPDTQIDSHPADPSKSARASFTFSSADGAAAFECSLDGGDYAACASPAIYTDLVDGSHAFAVRAKDPVNNLDATPASFTWTVNTTILYATPGGTGDCSSWANACALQTALGATNSGDEIWVAAGVHKPGTLRADTFQLKSGVAVYGGFAGTETAREQRNPAANITVLSGDIDNNDSQAPIITNLTTVTGNTTNNYHVVTGASGATMDGFTVTAGNANGDYLLGDGGGMYNNGSSPTLTNIIFSGNSASYGGGIYNYQSSPTLTNITFNSNSASVRGGGMYSTGGNPTLTNATLSGNSAGNVGGGMANSGSSPALTNVTFSGNSATEGGGGMFNASSGPTLTNVTFNGNSTTGYGGGMYNFYNSSPQIRNTIFWGNTASSGAQIYNDTSTPTVSYSVIQGGYAGGTNIITTDPLLGTLGNYGGFTQTIPLLLGSSAIDATSTNCPSADQRGVARTAPCDIGAFEAQNFTFTSNGTYDGWILESTETSSVGGTLNSAGGSFAIGDDAANKQYLSILHFDTSSLPDNAVLISVLLKIKKYALVGTDPFTTHGSLRADINNPYFGATAGLVIGDFQAAPDLSTAGTFSSTPVSNWYSAVLSSAGRSYVSRTGTTQFRLRFSTDDNNDLSADYLSFYSGNYATTTVRPQLIVEYYIP